MFSSKRVFVIINKVLGIVLFCALTLPSMSQSNRQMLIQSSSSQNALDPGSNGCATSRMQDLLYNQDAKALNRHQAIDQDLYQIISGIYQNQGNGLFKTSAQYTIPVVVHIIHNNGAENISDAQVLTGIQDLNDAFANFGVFDSTTGVSTDIGFCLASQDTAGNFSTGINRVQSSLTEMIMETQDLDVKNLVRWDPTRYLNVWLVKEINSNSMGPGVAGYAYFPSAHGQPYDGIMCEANTFGSAADGSKVMVHEIGHYLGLYHTFEGGCGNNDCLANGDQVCDTPPDGSTAAVNCGSSINTCTTDEDDISTNNPFRPIANGGLGDQDDMYINYMDYGNQTCQSAFTDGQRIRMVAALTGTRSSLLGSVVCEDPCTSPVAASFTVDTNIIFLDSSLVFTNTSTGGTSFLWVINGDTVSSSTNTTYMFTTIGTYTVELIVTNADPGCWDSAEEVVVVVCQAAASFTWSASNIGIGDSVTFTNTSPPAFSYEWFMDGTSLGTTTDLTMPFDYLGGYQVYLVAYNGTCYDTSAYAFIEVGMCTDNQDMIWYFGNGAGLDFKTTPPTVLTDGLISQYEGSASIADEDGNLLFYSDGKEIWNRNHTVMSGSGGLLGSSSASQTALIIPTPGEDSLYYVFTVPTAGAVGLNYSLVDMTLDGGNGDVSVLNVPLHTPVSEGLTATPHCNGQDIWVIAHDDVSNNFYSYLVSNTGVNSTPVISSVGEVGGSIGCLKVNRFGNKLAKTQTSANHLEVFDFDNVTGNISNPLKFETYPTFINPFGVEFSSDGTKLYATTWWSSPNAIWQFNMGAQDSLAWVNSAMVVGTAVADLGSLQLAPDGKIYVAKANTNPYVSVIHNPNAVGVACGYQNDAIYLQGGTSTLGLPNFMKGNICSEIYFDFTHTTPACTNYLTQFEAQTPACSSGYNWIWDFGDGSAADSTNAPLHQYAAEGVYSVTLIGFRNTLVDTVIRAVTITPAMLANFDYSDACVGAATVFNETATCSPVSWSWSFGDGSAVQTGASPNHSYAAAGSYDATLTVTWGGGFTDSIVKTVYIQADTGNANFSWLQNCEYYAQFVASSLGNVTNWVWDYGDGTTDDSIQNPEHWYGTVDTLQVTLIVEYGAQCPADTITKELTFPVYLVDILPNTACAGAPIQLTASWDSTAIFHDTYWDLGDGDWSFQQSPFHTYDTPGTYYIFTDAASNSGNCYEWLTDSIIVYPTPAIDLGNDTSLCSQSSFDFLAASFYENYLWQDGTVDSIYTATDPGEYWVQVMDSIGCINSDTVLITAINTPISLELGNDTAVCPGNILVLNAGDGSNAYLWWDNSTNSTYTAYTDGTFWAQVTNSCGTSIADTIVISQDSVQFINLGNDTSVCEGSLVTLDAGIGLSSYLWSDNTTSSITTVSLEGTYWIEGTNSNGCSNSDTILVTVITAPTASFSELVNEFSVTFTSSSSNASSYVWDFGDGNSTTTADPIHNYTQNGNYEVCLTVTNDCGFFVTCDSVTINVIDAGLIDIGPSAFEVKIIPNPTAGKFVIVVGEKQNQPLEINIYTVLGKLIYHRTEVSNGGGLEINLDSVSPGVYFVEVSSNGLVCVEKLVVE